MNKQTISPARKHNKARYTKYDQIKSPVQYIIFRITNEVWSLEEYLEQEDHMIEQQRKLREAKAATQN